MRKSRAWILPVFCWLVLTLGCSYRTRSFFFDGVPDPQNKKQAVPSDRSGHEPARSTTKTSYSEHGPFASRHCEGCHNRDLTNNLVVPKEQLCFQCHEFQMNKKYIHGPLASGGCLACHDPHNSKYRFLLKSETGSFCLDCHDEKAIAANEAHKGVGSNCTTCHDAHMSDKKYLLK